MSWVRKLLQGLIDRGQGVGQGDPTASASWLDRRKRRSIRKFRPGFEMLEDRLPPTTTINVSTYTDAGLRAAISTAIADSANHNPVTLNFSNGPGTIILGAASLDL